jgi:hypothetical protein
MNQPSCIHTPKMVCGYSSIVLARFFEQTKKADLLSQICLAVLQEIKFPQKPGQERLG